MVLCWQCARTALALCCADAEVLVVLCCCCGGAVLADHLGNVLELYRNNVSTLPVACRYGADAALTLYWWYPVFLRQYSTAATQYSCNMVHLGGFLPIRWVARAG